jgi:hypothetical protein
MEHSIGSCGSKDPSCTSNATSTPPPPPPTPSSSLPIQRHVTTKKKQSPSPFWEDWKNQNDDDDDDDNLETTSEILFGGRDELETSSSSEEEADCCLIQTNRNRISKPDYISRSSRSSSSSSCNKRRSCSSLEEDEHPALHQDLETIKYMAKREMSVQQERWNAITILPNAMYCLYFLLAAKWMPLVYQHDMHNDEAPDEEYNVIEFHVDTTHPVMSNGALVHDNDNNLGCLAPDHVLARLLHWYVLPPLPILAVAMGICFHAPFSFLYHWQYATQRVPTAHWSRRMDQAMIHVCSALVSYATSGDVRYFLANVIYNSECIIRQFAKRVQPKRNQRRIIFSMILYLMPLLRRQQFQKFMELGIVLGVSGWLFVAYPIGGWSHATFHLVVSLVPPLLMATTLDLPDSIAHVQRAVQCQHIHQTLIIHDY